MPLAAPPVSPAHPHTQVRYTPTALIQCARFLWCGCTEKREKEAAREKKHVKGAETGRSSEVCVLSPVCRMKLLLVAAAAAALLAVARCASLSLEDMEFHAWKLKFGESHEPWCSHGDLMLRSHQ